jgi:hypothetical protein
MGIFSPHFRIFLRLAGKVCIEKIGYRVGTDNAGRRADKCSLTGLGGKMFPKLRESRRSSNSNRLRLKWRFSADRTH